MPTELNISLSSNAESPTIKFVLTDDLAAILSDSTESMSPNITYVAIGATGPQGAPGTADVGTGEIVSSLIADGAVTNSKLGSMAVSASKLGTNAVSTSKIQNLAVSTDKIANNAITADKIAPGVVTAELLSDGAISTSKLGDGSIPTNKLTDEAVTTAKIAPNTITKAKIAAKTLTGAEIEDNVVLDGAKVRGSVQLLGDSPAFLKGPIQDVLNIQSERDLVFRVDSNNDQNSSFLYKNGAGTTILSIDESGNITMAGTIAGRNLAADGAKLDGISDNEAIDWTVAQTSNIHSGNYTDTNTQLTAEEVQDIVGAMLSSNTETRIAVTYDDSDGTIDFVVDDMTADTNTQLPLVDDDTMATASSTNVASAESVKAYVDSQTHLELGTTSTTALAGNTALLQLGTSSTTALAGDTTTISGSQASAITANTAKTGITSQQATDITTNNAKVGITTSQANAITANTAKTGITTSQANAITANTAKVDLTVDGAGTVHANNYTDTQYNIMGSGNGYAAGLVKAGGILHSGAFLRKDGSWAIPPDTNTTYSEATGSAEGLMSTAHHDKLDGIATGATAYTDANAVSALAAADDYLKNDASDTMSGSLTLEGSLFVQRSDGTNTTKAKLVNNSTTGNKTIDVPDASGTIALTNTHHHFIHAGWFMSYPYARYIPLNGSLNEQNTATSSPEYVNFTFPYDGYVKKMILRSETNMGSTNLKLYKGASGATVTTVLGNVSASVGASAAVEFDFTSVSNAYSKGDTMAIKVDPTEDPDGGQNITIELIFDLTT